MKRIGKLVTQIITTVIFIFAVMMTGFTLFTINKEDTAFFGYKPYVVLSDSMKGVFEVGDLIIIHKVDNASLKEGDIIAFTSIDPNNYGEIVTHKIRSITEYEGETAYITYGVNTGVDDVYPALESHVKGVYSTKVSRLGYFLQFLKTPKGYLIFIFIPFMVLILLQLHSLIELLKAYRKEQIDEMENKKKELLEQQIKTQEMIDKLEALKKDTKNE